MADPPFGQYGELKESFYGALERGEFAWPLIVAALEAKDREIKQLKVTQNQLLDQRHDIYLEVEGRKAQAEQREAEARRILRRIAMAVGNRTGQWRSRLLLVMYEENLQAWLEEPPDVAAENFLESKP